ncbi:uncharacterized protein LOC118647799 [Monomorium pharaonis]|uniref:uncharacterized protein LOC118647799 n=1 Tax=Monomorium pharaonis TaxID=307658 RepID=UPI0017474C69|nr:uncharacterized protein LOC118647799 [Monomorium pharaonis]
MLYKHGYFCGNARIEKIITRIVEARMTAKRYYENDASGCIESFLHRRRESGKKKILNSDKVGMKKVNIFYFNYGFFVGERPVARVSPFRTQYGRLSLRRRREAEVDEEAVPARRRRIDEVPEDDINAVAVPAAAAPPRVIPVVVLDSGKQ